MNRNLFAFLILLAVCAAGQNKPQNKTWSLGRTLDGQPDFQGVWTNATITPFERPADLAAKPYLTKEEAAKLERDAAANRVDRPPRPGDVGAYNQVWFLRGPKRKPSATSTPRTTRIPTST
jgi:hypothetical protein